MEVTIDSRIELVTIIQTLCNYWDDLSQKFYSKSLFSCRYKDNIQKYYKSFSHHKSIKLYRELCNDIPNIDEFLRLGLSCSEPPSFNSQIDNKCFPDNLYNFIDKVKSFYTDTNTELFFKNNKIEYNSILSDFNKNIDIVKYSNDIYNYLDIQEKIFKIIISPLIFGNFCISINTNNKDIINYIIISPVDYQDNKYIFRSESSIRCLLWHEICHSVINELTKKYIIQFNINNYEVPGIFKKQFYDKFETIINEYIIRSITIILESNYCDANSLIAYEKQNGFNNINLVVDFLRNNYVENKKFIKNDKYTKIIEYVLNILCP